ncbi:MAG TPA: chemotaxis protein CheW [Candidatus Nanopelagicales bacterium]|jgi:chemotaxis signal transduction protein
MSDVGGHLTFEVGRTSFAVDVADVMEVLRASEVRRLPGSGRTLSGRELCLVDVRGASVPVLDLRSEPTVVGDLIVPRYEDQVGLLVDRVTSVQRPGALILDPATGPALPSYASAVLRPAEGGTPMLLVELPRVPAIGDPAYEPATGPALGSSVLVQS